MSNSDRFVPLTLTVTPSESHYLYFPAEKNNEGKLARQLIIFRKQKVEYAVGEKAEKTRDERDKCYIRISTKSKDLIQEAKRSSKYLSENHNPRNKMNHVIDVWASKGLVFDVEGKPLPSSLSAPPEQSRANTDTPKKTKDSNLPTPSKPTNASTGAKDNGKPTVKARNPFISDSSSESGSSTYDPDGLFVPQNSRAYAKFLADEQKKAEGSKGKQAQEAPKKKKTSRELAKELFPSDEEDDDDNEISQPRPRQRTTEGRQSSNRVKSTNGKAGVVDLAGDKDIRKEGRGDRNPRRADTTGRPEVGIARRRDGRSRSPTNQPKDRRPRGESAHGSTRAPVGIAVRKNSGNQSTSTSTSKGRVHNSKASTGERLATYAGVFLKSQGEYNVGRQNWVEESDSADDGQTAMERDSERLEKIRREYRKKHGKPL